MPKTPFAASSPLQYSGFLSLYQVGFPIGNVYYVDSVSGTNQTTPMGWGKSPDAPFQTLQYAHDQCTSNNDDWIIMLPTHTETIASAGGISFTKNGIHVVGRGDKSSRPTFTWSTTASTFTSTGSGCTFENFQCTCSADEVVKLFNITGAYNTFHNVDYFETSTKQAVQFMLTTSATDYLTVEGCNHYQSTAAASAQKWIELVGCDGSRIINNRFFLTLNNAAGSVTISGSTAIINAEIAWNTIVQLGGTSQVSGILLVDGSTGSFVHDNRVAVGSTALPGIVDVGNAGYACENYVLNTPDRSGLLDPVVDS